MKIKKKHLKKLIKEFLETDDYKATQKSKDNISGISKFSYDLMPEEYKKYITNDIIRKVQDTFSQSSIIDESTDKTKRHIKVSGILDKVLSDTRLNDYVEVDGDYILSGILIDPNNPDAGFKDDDQIKSMISDIILSNFQDHMSNMQNFLLSGTIDPSSLAAGAKQSDAIIGEVPAFFLLAGNSIMPLLFALSLATEPGSQSVVAFLAITMYVTMYLLSLSFNSRVIKALNRDSNNYVDDLFQIHSDRRTYTSATLLERHIFDIFSDSEKQELSDKISELKEIRDTQKALSNDPKYIENLKAFVESHEVSDEEHKQLMQKYADDQVKLKDILDQIEQKKKDSAEKERVEKEIIDKLLDAQMDTGVISRSALGLDGLDDENEEYEEDEEEDNEEELDKKRLGKRVEFMRQQQQRR